MSPVAMCGIPKRERSMFACVPLPLPGAPYRSKFTVGPPHPAGLAARVGPPSPRVGWSSTDKAAVLAHDELRLQLFHGVQSDADVDQDRRSLQAHLLVGDDLDLR